MSIQTIKKELRDLKKEHAPNFKPIEVLLKSNPRTLTDQELFRCLQYYEPGLTVEDIEAEIQRMCDERELNS